MTGRMGWSLLMVLVSALLVSGVNVAYTHHLQRQADQRHAEQQSREKASEEQSRRQGLRVVCAWLEVRIDPDAPEPTTARGRDQLEADRRLYQQFGCGR